MNGLYGESQGDENRAGGRGAAVILLGERIADNEIVEGDAVAELMKFWDCALWGSFAAAYDRLRTIGLERGADYFGGDKDGKDYKKWQTCFTQRLQSIVTRATFGLPVALQARGETFGDGAGIPSLNALVGK